MLQKLPSVWGKHQDIGDQAYASAEKKIIVGERSKPLFLRVFWFVSLQLFAASLSSTLYQSLIAPETSSLLLPLPSLPASSLLPGKAAVYAVLALSYTALLRCTVHAAR